MVESVVSLEILCPCLCIIAVSSFPMSEKGVTIGKMLVSVCGVLWKITGAKRITYFSLQIYFGTVFLRQCMCV